MKLMKGMKVFAFSMNRDGRRAYTVGGLVVDDHLDVSDGVFDKSCWLRAIVLA